MSSYDFSLQTHQISSLSAFLFSHHFKLPETSLSLRHDVSVLSARNAYRSKSGAQKVQPVIKSEKEHRKYLFQK